MTTKAPEEIANILEKSPVFSGVRESIVESLIESMLSKSLQQDEVLFTQMEHADAAYIVVSGCVAMFLATPEGKELVINEMQPGDCFGELSLITQKPRSTGAIARELSELLVIPSEAFMAALRADTRLMSRVLETTASRLRRSSEREIALAFLDSDARIAQTLFELDQNSGGVGFVRITQDILGQYVGLTRQTVAKTLGVWRRKGWVITTRGGIRILNKKALEVLATDTDLDEA